MKLKQLTLKNGLNVFLVPQKEAASVGVELMVRAGSRNEPEGKQGRAHFLEHMAFKGTEKWPTAKKLAKVLDSVGAVYNAYTDKEKTGYWIKVAPQYLSLSLEIISEMMTAALLRTEEIDLERGVIVEEINMYEDRPMDKVDDLFEEQILGANPLGRSIIGKKETILAIKRKDFVDFKKTWYQAGKMSLAVVGAIKNTQKTIDEIVRLFEKISSGQRQEDKVSPLSKREALYWQKKDTQQTHFVLGLPTVALGDRLEWVADVFSAILGGGMSSRLWLSIRERRGWAYYVYARQKCYSSTGFLAIHAGVKNQIAFQAIDLVKDELAKIVSNLKKSEVEQAKKMIIGRTWIKMEEAMEVASLLNDSWLFEKKVLTPEKLVKKIETVKFLDTVEFAKKFINLDFLRGAVIGPKTGN